MADRSKSETPIQPTATINVASLRVLRNATRDYIVVLDAAWEALTPEAVQHEPQLYHLRTAIGVSIGKLGHAGLGTALGIEHQISRCLGEAS